jgi:hypothetical protein
MSAQQKNHLAEPTSGDQGTQGSRGMSALSISAIVLSAVITVAALAGVIVHLAEPNMQVDSIVVALLVIAIIPWLGLIFKSVEIPGLFKGEFQDLARKVDSHSEKIDRNSEEIGRNSKKIDTVETAISNEVEDLGGTMKEASNAAPAHPPVAFVPGQDPKQRYEALIKNYNDIRDTQPVGSARTLAMTAVIQEMIKLAPQNQDFDWRTSLNSSDRGVRLAAYALLYACPRLDAVDALVDTIIHVEDKPFGQYWALLALEKATDKLDCETARRIKPILKSSFLSSLSPGTDRYGVLQRLLDEFEVKISRLCRET